MRLLLKSLALCLDTVRRDGSMIRDRLQLNSGAQVEAQASGVNGSATPESDDVS